MLAAGILAGKGANVGNLFYTTSKDLRLHETTFRFNKNFWAKEIGQEAHTMSRRQGARPLSPGPPGGLPAAIFCYMKGFVLEKIVGKPTGGNSAGTRRNQSRALAELFCRGHFPPGGGNHHQRHHQRSSHREGVNLHQHLH